MVFCSISLHTLAPPSHYTHKHTPTSHCTLAHIPYQTLAHPTARAFTSPPHKQLTYSCMCCLAFPHRRVMLTSSLLSSGQLCSSVLSQLPFVTPLPPTHLPLPPLPCLSFLLPILFPPFTASFHSISPPLTLLLLPSPSLSDEGGQLDFSVVSEGSIPRSLLDPSDGNHFRTSLRLAL